MPSVLLFLALVLLAACDSGERQRLQLVELERMNRADSLMLNDSLARDLAEWFDRHGTRNEQLRAYYMLGRTYADRGETPQALEAYNDAVDRADTTATDCNYYTLCRVYAQMSDIFYMQNLISDQLRCLNQSIRYAYLSNDTIAALTSYAHKLLSYDKLGLNDSLISICENVYTSFCKLGSLQMASQYYLYAVRAYTANGNYERARFCMDIYEKESGYFDDQCNIEPGREVYYAAKGDFYQAIGKYDSAEYYYRKELEKGRDFNNQTLASQGLSKLYTNIQNSDSAAKYATYAYAMNDSNYVYMATSDIERIEIAYNYNRQQRRVQFEKARADRERTKVLCLITALFFLLIICGCVVIAYKKKKEKAFIAYKGKVRELESLQTDMLCLRSHDDELGELLSEKELQLKQLRKEVDAYQRKANITIRDREIKLKESDEYLQLQKKAVVGKNLSNEEWHQLNRLVIDIIPDFYYFVSVEHTNLSLNESRIVLLIRLHIPPMSISKMMNVSASYISKVVGNISAKLYQEKLDAKMLEMRISNHC